jgi:hypothetical protein
MVVRDHSGSGRLSTRVGVLVGAYTQYPIMFIILAAILCALLIFSSKSAAAINDRMTTLWRESLAHGQPAPAIPPSNVPAGKERLFLNLRSSWKDYIGPTVSAIAIAYVAVALVDRWVFTALDDAGFVCTQSQTLKDFPDEGVLFSFPVSDPCFATGYRVGRLSRYLIWTTPDPDQLNKRFAGHKAIPGQCVASAKEKLVNWTVEADARGYSAFHNEKGPELSLWEMMWNTLLLPVRRYYSQPWLQPIARYGSIGSEVDFLEPDPDPKFTEISEHVTPKVPGELFFYFNDAVVGLPRSFQWFYGDNKGCATFFVKPSK